MKVESPLLVPVLAALPVCACMAILGLPAFGHGYAAAFRTLFFVACLAWLIPLTLLQRAMWRREWPWLRMALMLLATSYAMSILNAVLGQRLAISLGLEMGYHWADLVRGLDGCWLALIAFCAVHAVAAYYLSLQRARMHLAQAQSAARDAELRALRLQVNPHFLFNSLNAISALVSAQSNREANRMLGCVSDFLLVHRAAGHDRRAVLAHKPGRLAVPARRQCAARQPLLHARSGGSTTTPQQGTRMLQPCLPTRRFDDARRKRITRIFFTQLSNDS